MAWLLVQFPWTHTILCSVNSRHRLCVLTRLYKHIIHLVSWPKTFVSFILTTFSANVIKTQHTKCTYVNAKHICRRSVTSNHCHPFVRTSCNCTIGVTCVRGVFVKPYECYIILIAWIRLISMDLFYCMNAVAMTWQVLHIGRLANNLRRS